MRLTQKLPDAIAMKKLMSTADRERTLTSGELDSISALT
jgi:hypothetical protein